MRDHTFKQLVYAQFAVVAKALASPARLELLDLLAQAERSVDDLAHEAQLSIANTSAHLQVLARAHLVATRKVGVSVFYRLADPSVYHVWSALQTTAEQQLAEIDRLVATYRHERQTLETMGRDALLARLHDPATLVLDVRPSLEYQQGHIAGACSVPLDGLADWLRDLPRDRAIIAYCRGPYCVFADEAVALLLQHGFVATRYAEGYPAWFAAGLPVEGMTTASPV